jgi:hypothetical protein
MRVCAKTKIGEKIKVTHIGIKSSYTVMHAALYKCSTKHHIPPLIIYSRHLCTWWSVAPCSSLCTVVLSTNVASGEYPGDILHPQLFYHTCTQYDEDLRSTEYSYDIISMDHNNPTPQNHCVGTSELGLLFKFLYFDILIFVFCILYFLHSFIR